jgi:Holliday junction resolvase RusA-like endonuclease
MLSFKQARKAARHETRYPMTPKMPIARATRRAVATNSVETSISLHSPWVVLVRDNARHGLSRGRIILTREYRDKLEAARLLVAFAMAGHSPLVCRVALVATFHEPDRSRKRDVTNYAKLLCDALVGRAIGDDSQIDDARYVRGAIDPKDPRVEVTIQALAPAGAVAR